jgi:predicted metal-dependent enzyme (double-stranded beta helix superfamily)
MQTTARTVFSAFVDDVRQVWSKPISVGDRIHLVKPLLEGLVRDPVIRDATKDWPSTDGVGNMLLYTDPEDEFVVNAVVRTPGRKGNVHDHADAWVLYGLVHGTETLERFERVDDGSRPGHAIVKLTSASTGRAGHVDVVPPRDIHAEQGGPEKSVAIIFRSVRLVGRVLQNGYDPATNTVVERSGPKQTPYEFA